MESEAGWEVAGIILIHKIKHMAPDDYCDLGLLTLKDVKNGILFQFQPHEVETAIEYAAQNNILDIYYEARCASCNHTGYILETDAGQKAVANRLLGSKLSCEICGGKISGVSSYTEIDKRYAIPNYLLAGGGDQPSAAKEMPIHRAFRWATSWLTRDS